MHTRVKSIVVVGGGTAGWLAAGLLAAQMDERGARRFHVSVIEPPDIPIIGVGEGTWPTMRDTLRRIGVSERDFLRACHGAFKQGSHFRGWRHGGDDFYYHPFEPPRASGAGDPASAWLAAATQNSFSRDLCFQEDLCAAHRAPKMLTSPDYAGVTNYGYHFDAGALAGFLRDHSTRNLGVTLIADAMAGVTMAGVTMAGVTMADERRIEAIETRNSGVVAGDFFVDCTGFHGLLVKGHFGIASQPLGDILLADRALAAHMPYEDDEPIASVTKGSAQAAGWIWDIGLKTRRGVGYVHASAYADREAAEETLRRYLSAGGRDISGLKTRYLTFTPGYLKEFWVGNCAAIGLSAGFVEPLEASAIMLTELGVRDLAQSLMDKAAITMESAAAGFNARMTAHWQEVVNFLKLHYILSERPEKFWQDNRAPETVPAMLRDDLERWAHHVPHADDFADRSRIFPPESYQYVLYGAMGPRRAGQEPFQLPRPSGGDAHGALATKAVRREADRLMRLLPTNRALLAQLA